jgi:hypothetical protein
MKISNLIIRLQETQARFGDLDVVVGEVSSLTRSMFDVNVDTKGKHDGTSWDDKICIVQAYTKLS